MKAPKRFARLLVIMAFFHRGTLVDTVFFRRTTNLIFQIGNHHPEFTNPAGKLAHQIFGRFGLLKSSGCFAFARGMAAGAPVLIMHLLEHFFTFPKPLF